MNLKFFILASLLTDRDCSGADQPVVTVPDELRALVQQANTNYPVLKQQQQQIQAGELRVDIARTAMRPNVTGMAVTLHDSRSPGCTTGRRAGHSGSNSAPITASTATVVLGKRFTIGAVPMRPFGRRRIMCRCCAGVWRLPSKRWPIRWPQLITVLDFCNGV